MNSQTDAELLHAYAEDQSESAFSELVCRYVDLVYSAALRMMKDSHRAKDITQGAFMALAKDAPRLISHPVLSAWLHRTTQNIAGQSIRTETRRVAREKEFIDMNIIPEDPSALWTEISPHLDDAIRHLSDSDRDVIFLRYFEGKSAREMAQRLGVSDEAAQKRVNRAVERLREIFAGRGIAIPAAGLTVISAYAVQAAPAGLATAISSALATTVTTTAVIHTMSWISAKSITSIAIAAVIGGAGVYFANQPAVERLRQENQSLRAQQAVAANENQKILAAAQAAQTELERLRAGQAELIRLRARVAELRRDASARRSAEALPNSKAPSTRPGTYMTKEALGNVGYDSPEAALQTITWAMLNADYDTANIGRSPDLLAAEPPNEKDREQFEEQQKISARIFKGLQILAQKEISPDRVELKIKVDADPFPGQRPDESPSLLIQPMAKVGENWLLGGSTHAYNNEWEKDGEIQLFVPYSGCGLYVKE